MVLIELLRFNSQYSPIVPILSSLPMPDETFRESELKFWVIVTLGSKKCIPATTLFLALSAPVEKLAMSSLRLGGSPYPVIEALLLMCTWHLSTDKPFFSSLYPTISSAVLSLTLQAGLHRCWSLHSIFPNGNTHPDPYEARGAKLWAYAVITAQR